MYASNFYFLFNFQFFSLPHDKIPNDLIAQIFQLLWTICLVKISLHYGCWLGYIIFQPWTISHYTSELSIRDIFHPPRMVSTSDWDISIMVPSLTNTFKAKKLIVWVSIVLENSILYALSLKEIPYCHPKLLRYHQWIFSKFAVLHIIFQR